MTKKLTDSNHKDGIGRGDRQAIFYTAYDFPDDFIHERMRSMDFRNDLHHSINEVFYTNKNIVLTRREKPMCVVMSIEDFLKLKEAVNEQKKNA